MRQDFGKDLFSIVQKGKASFNNAMVMAPMTRSRAIGTIPNDLMRIYYSQRASAGLIITEGTSPSPNGLGYARTPGIFSDEQVDAWKNITEAVHERDGKIFLQLMHVGRVAHASNMPAGAEILAPSAVQASGEMWTDALGMQKKEPPRAMTLPEVHTTIQEFVAAAVNAIKAGFDGVEFHGANGYLIEQFLNPRTNQRTDAYGGTIENRSRFLLEVTDAVAESIGKDRVGVRLSPYNTFNDMSLYPETFDTYRYLVEELAKRDILYLHIVDYAARASEEGQRLLQTIRTKFHNILILNGGYTRERAVQALQQEGADMISFGSSFIANPDLPYRLQHGKTLNNPIPETFYTSGAEGYTDYTFAEREVVAQ